MFGDIVCRIPYEESFDVAGKSRTEKYRFCRYDYKDNSYVYGQIITTSIELSEIKPQYLINLLNEK